MRRIKYATIFMVAMLAASAFAEAAEYKRDAEGYMPWATVGRSPCREGTGTTCTLRAAIEHSGYSIETRIALLDEIEAGNKTRVLVERGVRFDFVQFRNDGFVDRVVTAWKAIEKKFADLYVTTVGDRRYEAYLFTACKNWAMRWDYFVASPPKIVPLIEGFERGDIPATNCQGAGCDSCN